MSSARQETGTLATLALMAALAFAATATAQPAAPGSVDDLFARVARRVNSFGGLYVDESTGTLRAYSWNRTPAGVAAVRSALRAVFADRLPAGRIEVVPGQYGFGELNAWHARLRDVLAMPGVVSTDVDDRANRLRVGVERADVGWAVRDRLGALGVPGEAVDVVETAPVRLENLTAFHRPLVGGLQLNFASGNSSFLCTLGFNAVRGGVSGFVTNSHCTATQGGVQGTIYFQPLSSAANRVGVETVDPVYFTGAPCPPSRRCRRSDTAFVRRDAGVSASLGRVARPGVGSVAWNGTATFRIVRESDPLVGQSMTKVGRTSGRTNGSVSQTCVNLNVFQSKVTQLCQAIAGYSSAGGDSGSPVFRIANSPQANDVWLAGIHWGSGGAFSMIGQIQLSTVPAELGTINTCASGFAC